MKRRKHNLKRTDLVWCTGGYWMCKPEEGYRPAKLIQGRYVPYHRMRIEQKIGRRLRKGECVIFRNGNQHDLRSQNFLLTDRKGLAAHRNRHVKRNCRCRRCGRAFHLPRSRVRKGDGQFCSWACRYGKRNG